jgi:hypothetical protein
MENAPRTAPLRFSDFAEPGGPLEGKKVRIDDVTNIEIMLVTYSMKESKYQKSSARECLTIQFEYPDKPGEKHVIFTGSNILIEQLKKYEDKLPFLATIRKKDRYYTLS